MADVLLLVLTRQAGRDIQNVSRWTNKNFGARQAMLYRASIAKLGHRIAATPFGTGSHQLDFSSNPLWSIHLRVVFTRGRHLMLYRVNETSVSLVRVLHDEMNIAAHVQAAQSL